MRLLAQREEDLREGQYDVVVVIPSYDEGYRFLRMLESVAVQEGVEDVRTAVLLVLNNAADARPNVRASNERGQRLVEALWAGEPPADLETNTETHSVSAELRIQAFRAVAASRARLLLMDLFSEGHAPETCNVGIARDEGGRAAARLLKERGVIAFSDADGWYRKTYLSGLRTTYAAGADAATGPIETFPADDLASIRAEELRETESRLRRAQQMIQHALGATNMLHPEGTHMMSGANLTVRREEFLAAGGIDHVAGGEDIAFACKLIDRGKTIAYSGEMTVVTPGRVSLRTHEDHGYGQRIARMTAHIADYGALPTMGLLGRRLADALVRRMREARDLAPDDEAAWKAHMAAFRYAEREAEAPPLLPAEIDELWREYRRAPRIPRLDDNDFVFRATERMARARMPDTRMALALLEAESALVNAEDEPGARQTASRFFELRRIARPAVEAMRREAAVRAVEMAEAHEVPLGVGLLVYGLPHDEADARNATVLSHSYDVLRAAALKADERRLVGLSRLAAEAAASGGDDAGETARRVLAEIPAAVERVLTAQVCDAALLRLFEETYEALRVDPEDRESLRAFIEPAIEPLRRAIEEELSACEPLAARVTEARDALAALAGGRRGEMERGIEVFLAAFAGLRADQADRWTSLDAGPSSES